MSDLALTTPTALAYRTSSYCASGACVEVAPLPDGGVALRDSKDTELAPHVFTAAEWDAFVLGVKAGEFDLGRRI